MSRASLLSPLAALVFAAGAPAASAAAESTWQIAAPVEFQDGNAAMRQRLQVLAPLRKLIAEPFGYALVDLDDDGSRELIVIARSSGFCGSGGCRAVVMQLKRGQAPRTLLDQYLVESIATTREKAGGFRALAIVANGGIQIADRLGSPLHGKPMVYPMDGAEARPQAQAVPARAEAPVPPTAAGSGPDLLGIRLGESTASDVRSVLGTLKGPRDNLTETRLELVAQDGTQRVKVPGSAYAGELGLRKPAQGCPEREGCDQIVVHMSSDPGAERVMHVYRRHSFPAVPYEALLQSMIVKWGTASGIDERWHLWAWRADGSRLGALEKSSPCWKARDIAADYKNPEMDIMRNIRDALLQGGCARVVVVATLSRREAGLVDEQRTGLLDAQLMSRNAVQRQQRIDAFMAQRQQGRKQEAERNPTPRL